MKITFRLIVSLFVAATIVATVFTYIQVQDEQTTLKKELDIRASVVAEGLQESITEYIQSNAISKLNKAVARFGARSKLVGIAVYDAQGNNLVSSLNVKNIFASTPGKVWEAISRNETISSLELLDGKKSHIYIIPLTQENKVIGAILLYHDASFIDIRVKEIWKDNFIRLLTQAVLIIIATVLVVRWSITGPIAQIAKWMRSLRTGKIAQPIAIPRGDLLEPIATEISLLAKSLAQARASAQEEARLRMEGEALWTAERLKEHVKTQLNGRNFYVVSNREPYMHVISENTIKCIVPAGGLVTALDPIMQACGGLWIAHGSGNADREMVDEKNKIPVPPEEPAYTLKRVFLTKEEEEGYYYGFSNEGLWPLCHITHTRPVFKLDDWIQYQKVNQIFADALIEEIENEESPLILIQDYHFALLPLLIKSKRADARIALFWHIPWPNPEVFGICPWKQEILVCLLGADLIGFQTQFHCNNFLETIDRFLESKINWDQFTVERQGLITTVRPFPISVSYPFETETFEINKQSQPDKQAILKQLGIGAKFIGVGVDRIDYTKGILERFRAIERFFEKYPEYIGQFTFIELGAPSRTHIKRYHDLLAEIDESVDKINWKYQTKNWKPIVLLKANHDHKTIANYYRIADFCMVTSLHDGMNLVAKEFIAARTDEEGVLILSQFTGASRELIDALIINPYDIEEMAEAIYISLTMDKKERQERMKQLRKTVRDRNVYRWAANIITTLTQLRPVKQPAVVEN